MLNMLFLGVLIVFFDAGRWTVLRRNGRLADRAIESSAGRARVVDSRVNLNGVIGIWFGCGGSALEP